MTNPSLRIGANMETFNPSKLPKSLKPIQPTTNRPVERDMNQNKSIYEQSIDIEPSINEEKK